MVEISFIDIDVIQGSGSSGSGVVTEPVTLQQVKDHLYIDGTQDDTLLTSLITSCRRSIENYCHISIVNSTVTATLRIENKPHLKFQSRNTIYAANIETELPLGPVKNVSLIQWIDSNDNVLDLVPGEDYHIRGTRYKTILVSNSFDNLIMVYTTGYDAVPIDLQLGLLNEIAFRFEARGDGTNRYAQQNVGISEAAEYLVKPYQRLAWQ